MLSETTLKKECKKYNLDGDGNKIELITRLGRTIKDRERKMLTMGPAHEKLISHDVTPIHKVDEEDLPKVTKIQSTFSLLNRLLNNIEKLFFATHFI